MANLIDDTYFIGDISLPAQKVSGTLENISTYITKYEKKVLIELLGYDLYKPLKVQIDAEAPYSAPWKDFIEGAEYSVEAGGGTHTVKWNGLTNTDLTSLIAYYIYFNYMRDFVTYTSGIGEVLSNSENAARITPASKMSHAWNEHLALYGKLNDGELTPSAYRYLKENESSFDLWVFTPKKSVNSFDI